MAIAHRFTRQDQYYITSAEDYGYPPYNSTPEGLPPRPWVKKWPQYVNSAWVLVEDHRKRKSPAFAIEDAQDGTDFWLPGDTHDTPARHMNKPGPLPEGAITERPAAPEPTTDELFAQLRAARDAKLTATDKYLLPDYPISADALSAIKAYRQALRDLPDQDGAPWDGGGDATPWPELPEV